MDTLKTNVLYYGDNLEILRKHIPENSIDLIYLDPPFNSKKDYNILFKENGVVKSQILTIEELLHGKAVDMSPQNQTSVTFVKSPKVSQKEGEQLSMD
jgi:16S rRNA G966 N2-methylase RsmD